MFNIRVYIKQMVFAYQKIDIHFLDENGKKINVTTKMIHI